MRLIVVSNRLPITVTEENGEYTIKESVGGLVTGLSSYLSTMKGSSLDKSGFVWVGWPGLSPPPDRQVLLKQKAEEMSLIPVFLPEKIMERFYHGFCNKTIWPQFHYFSTYTVFDADFWNKYKYVNELFCRRVAEIARPDDVIWIHDYHLMLLPKMLKEQLPESKIGFFLHIPFPSFETYRVLPPAWRKEILEGLLGADLTGFHTYDYTKYFLSCVTRLLGYENNMGLVSMPERVAKAAPFPMGINYEEFVDAVNSNEAVAEVETFKKQFGGSKLILSIDRLDYTKGILNRLRGYSEFLRKNPEWHGKVNLIAIVVPSRIGVDRYNLMKREIDERVGNINGRFGNIYWTPIIYQYRFIPFFQLAGLYKASDVSLVTPLRDGMNLIAKEYLACRTDETGVLILSETAGASKELNEAVIINPNDSTEIASAIKEALEMPVEEQIKRNRIMRGRLKRYNVVRWADSFLSELKKVKDIQKELEARLLDSPNREGLIKRFGKSKNRLILLDYDGTLVPFAGRPEDAAPSDELLGLLTKLAGCTKNHVVIISGRDRNTLDNWLGKLNSTLIAEHGLWKKTPGNDWKMTAQIHRDWKASLLPVLQSFSDLLPGSLIEEKDYSLVWHYRRSDPEQAFEITNEVLDDLVSITANMDVQVMQGNKVIEIRNSGINKGSLASLLISEDVYDFILAIGDDLTDEDMFQALPEEAYSIKVGIKTSHSKYNLQNFTEVTRLLEELS